LHEDVLSLVSLAGWKPAEIKQFPYRERRYWARHYQAIEDHKVMQAVTAR
jgi:hypothetical protein